MQRHHHSCCRDEKTEAGFRLPPCPLPPSQCVPCGQLGGVGGTREDGPFLTGPPSGDGDGCLQSKHSKRKGEKRCGSELSRPSWLRGVCIICPRCSKKKTQITFLNYTPACIIGITHPRRIYSNRHPLSGPPASQYQLC